MKIRLVGDIHSKFNLYKNVVSDCDYSIQLGDFGVGYRTDGGIEFDMMVKEWQHSNPNHKFFRGNHDNLSVCKHMPNFISDGTYLKEYDIFCCGGAWSIDYHMNTEGINCWPDEELTYKEFEIVIEAYEKVKPRIMLTHDCPQSVVYPMFKAQYIEETITRMALDTMFSIHQPEYWIHGHWHFHRRETINGTKFVCLEELQYMDIEA